MKTIKEMLLKVKQFNQYYDARMKVRDKLQEAYNTLSPYKGKRVGIEGKQTIKLLSKEFDEALVRELKAIQRKLARDLHVEKVKLFGEVVRYVWSHPDKNEKLIISKIDDDIEVGEHDFRPGYVFIFDGELGDLLKLASDFSCFQNMQFITFDKQVQLYSELSANEAKEIIVSFFVGEDKDYFQKNM